MAKRTRDGLTLIECLVSLVASSIILGGFLGLYTVADQAARSNTSDVYSTSMDYNLDRVLTEIATATSITTRRAFPHPGAFGDNAPLPNSPNQFLVYERPRKLVPTSYWTSAQRGPGAANAIPAAMVDYDKHPFPLFINPSTSAPLDMTNIDLQKVDTSNYPFSDNWMTGIIALHRRDPYDVDGDGAPDRFRTGILWQFETPMPRMRDYGFTGALRGATFCPNLATPGAGFADAVPIGTINGFLNTDNPHLNFAGARILAVGVQTFLVTAGEPMTWTVAR